jgi:hypothetical protein
VSVDLVLDCCYFFVVVLNILRSSFLEDTGLLSTSLPSVDFSVMVVVSGSG